MMAGELIICEVFWEDRTLVGGVLWSGKGIGSGVSKGLSESSSTFRNAP
jgi:hypothetical protein